MRCFRNICIGFTHCYKTPATAAVLTSISAQSTSRVPSAYAKYAQTNTEKKTKFYIWCQKFLPENTHRHNEREQQKDEPKPDLDLRKFRIVSFEEKLQTMDVVALMERFEPIEIHRQYVVSVLQEAQMQHNKLVALLAHTNQMASPIVDIVAVQYRFQLMLLGDTVDGDADMETFVEHFVVRIFRFDFGNHPHLLRIGGQQFGFEHKRAAGQEVRSFRCGGVL
jgi:hypothetical protein